MPLVEIESPNVAQEEQEKVTKAFISYSHDSPAHKAWVAELATKLREKGIDVRLDLWNLRLGEDVPKFMERSVAWADRVLMICTDAYVRKANEGKGGVGYEAMVVTAELIKDLGTTKFIPIIRQEGGKKDVPTFMGTRLYVDLSKGQNFEEEFERLLRDLHDELAPKKPPIGKNPFAKAVAGNESRVVQSTMLPAIASQPLPEDISIIYSTAIEIAQQEDLIAWRRISKQSKALIPQKLAEWRKRWESKEGGLLDADLPDMCLDGLSAYAPLMCVALAGVESGKDAFNDQTGVLDEIMFPKDWQRNGTIAIIDFPDTAAFVYQAVHGALCMETEQLECAIRLATTRIQRPYDNKSRRLFEINDLIGWPDSLGGSCTKAWEFILKLSNNVSWVTQLFGDTDSYKAALYAYYLALNIFELADAIASGMSLIKGEFWTSVPVCPIGVTDEQIRKAYRLLIQDPKALSKMWEQRGITTEKMKAAWPQWIKISENMLNKLNVWIRTERALPHRKLFEDLAF